MRDKTFSRAMAVLESLAGILMIAMVVVITIQLIGRNFLKISTPWTEDTAKLLLIWMTFLGAPVLLHRGEHLMVDLIYAALSPRVRKYVRLLSSLVVLVFCLIIIKLGIDLCTNKVILRSTTAAANIPRVYMYSALPVGGLLMGLVSLNALVDNILILLGRKEDVQKERLVDENKTLDELEEEEKE